MTFLRQVRGVVNEHPIVCLASLGVVPASYALGKLLWHAIQWLREAHGSVHRMRAAARNGLSPLAQRATSYTNVNFWGTRSVLYHVPVLDQGNDGNCARHAFKNCLVMLGLGRPFVPDDLTSEQLFSNELFRDGYWSLYYGDFLLRVLASWDKPFADATSVEIQKFVQCNADSISSVDEIESGLDRRHLLGDSYRLKTVSNLYDVSRMLRERRSFQHAFFTTSLNYFSSRYRSHAISLLLSVNEAGEISWYGADSLHNGRSRFRRAVASIEQAVHQFESKEGVLQAFDGYLNSSSCPLDYGIEALQRVKAGDRSGIKDFLAPISGHKEGFLDIVDFMAKFDLLDEDPSAKYSQTVAKLKQLAELYLVKYPQNFQVRHASELLHVGAAHRFVKSPVTKGCDQIRKLDTL